LDGRAVAGLASIEVKRDEAGLLDFAARLGLPLVFFASDQLNQVEGVSISAAALKATGAKGVAEPAALLAAGPGSLLVVAKEKWPDVTVAVAEKADPLAVAKGCQESTIPPCDQPTSLQVGHRRDKNP
jgi:cobalt-precorrin 5A hydrolase